MVNLIAIHKPCINHASNGVFSRLFVGCGRYAQLAQKAGNGYKRGTYARERVIGYKALKTAGLSKDAAKNYIRVADKYFNSIGLEMKTVTRIPLR